MHKISIMILMLHQDNLTSDADTAENKVTLELKKKKNEQGSTITKVRG